MPKLLKTILQETQALILAAILAVLIWLWAEGETVVPREMQLDLSLVQPGAKSLLISPAKIESVRIQYRATPSQQLRLRDYINSNKTLRLEVSETKRLDLLSEIKAATDFEGVYITSVTPKDASVSVTRLVTTGPIPIEKPEPTDKEFSVTFLERSDAQLQVTELFEAQAKLQKRLLLDARELSAGQENVPREGLVSLALPADLLAPNANAQVKPEKVKVRVTWRYITTTKTLPLVRVRLTFDNPADANNYIVKPGDDYLRDVPITGPTQAVQTLLNRPSSEFSASLVLTSKELERIALLPATTDVAPVEIDLPPGVQTSGPPLNIKVTVTRRVSTVPAPAPAPGTPP